MVQQRLFLVDFPSSAMFDPSPAGQAGQFTAEVLSVFGSEPGEESAEGRPTGWLMVGWWLVGWTL